MLPVPLLHPDPDVTLDVQEVVDRAYDAAGFAKYIYQQPLTPPLNPVDAAWADEIVQRKSK